MLVEGQSKSSDLRWQGGHGRSCYQLGATLMILEEGTATLEDCKTVCGSNSRCVAVFHDEQNKRCFLYSTKPVEAAGDCITGRGCDTNLDGNCHVLLTRDSKPIISISTSGSGSLRGSGANLDSDSKGSQDTVPAKLDFTSERNMIELCKEVDCTFDEVCDVDWHHTTDEPPEAYCRQVQGKKVDSREEPREENVEHIGTSPAAYLLLPLSAIVLCAICGYIRSRVIRENSEHRPAPSKKGLPTPQSAKMAEHPTSELQKELPTVLVDYHSEKSEMPKEGLLPKWVTAAPEAQRGRQQARTSPHSRKERSTSPTGSNASSQSKRSARSTGSALSTASKASIRAMKAIEGHPDARDASDISTDVTGDSLYDHHLPAAKALAKQWDAQSADSRGRSSHRTPKDARSREESPSSSVGSRQSRRSQRNNRV